jgi:hypothetical protein
MKPSLLVRLSESQLAFIERLAQEQGDSKSSIVRQIISKYQKLEAKENA